MAIINTNKNYIFIHIYKAGGTTIRTMLHGSFELCDVHAPAWQVKKALSQTGSIDFWNNCFKFAQVRNPYDFLVSLYHHLNRSIGHPFHHLALTDFHQFVKDLYDVFGTIEWHGYSMFEPQWYFVSQDGLQIVDKIYRFDTINQNVNEIAARINSAPQSKPQNVSENRPTKSVIDFYDESTIKLVNEMYDIDFFKFGYPKF